MTAMLGPHRKAKGKTDSWLTPRWILDELGTFDLDPCCPPTMPWKTAKKQYHEGKQDGLSKRWRGRVWLNPPYGKSIDLWLNKLAAHGSGIALVFARTDTKWAQEAILAADAVLFISGRLTFHHENGEPAAASAGAPSMLLAYGRDDGERLALSCIKGRLFFKDQYRKRETLGEASAPEDEQPANKPNLNIPNAEIKNLNFAPRIQNCTECGLTCRRHLRRKRYLRDIGESRPLVLAVTVGMYWCNNCGKYFVSDLSNLAPPRSRYTYRAINMALHHLQNNSFNATQQMLREFSFINIPITSLSDMKAQADLTRIGTFERKDMPKLKAVGREVMDLISDAFDFEYEPGRRGAALRGVQLLSSV